MSKRFICVLATHAIPPGPDGTHSNFREMIATVCQPIIEGFFPDQKEYKAITMPDGALYVGYFEE